MRTFSATRRPGAASISRRAVWSAPLRWMQLGLVLLSSCAGERAARGPATADAPPGAPSLGAVGTAAARLHRELPADFEPSLAFHLVDVVLEAAARDVERIGARPTILSRQMAIPITAMFDAWAAHDDVALGTVGGDRLRRPPAERSAAERAVAIAYATLRCALDQFPYQAAYLRDELRALGHDPELTDCDPSTPAGLGNLIARELIAARHGDGANQLGDERGSNGEPYSDYTMYQPVNPPDRIVDPDRWQPIPFDDGDGGQVVHGFLTPHWYRVRPFGLERADQFRPGPPPRVGSDLLREQVDQCIAWNAALDPEQKAIVEFMRDGPRSTGQSGHWLRFAQDVSVRDQNDLDADVVLFFAVANTAFDAFIASWEAKRYYDSSRPWTLVRHFYTGETLLGWGGPGKGTVELDGGEWHPYSPATFVTPPFPGYPSGHSTVSGACAEMLRLLTGSDRFDVVEARRAGELTEADASCDQMQQFRGRLPVLPPGQALTCDVRLPLPTFTATAELAGISRVLGGYHIQADNTAGLTQGRAVARHLHPIIRAHVEGTLQR